MLPEEKASNLGLQFGMRSLLPPPVSKLGAPCRMTKCRNKGEAFIFIAPDSSPLRNCTYLWGTVAKTPQLTPRCWETQEQAVGNGNCVWRPWGHLVPLHTKSSSYPMLESRGVAARRELHPQLWERLALCH